MKLSEKTLFLLPLIIILAAILRLFHLGDIPPSLYSDEAGQGYNAFSILHTGRDEFGTFLPVSLESFGDWKPALSTYLMIPFISLFGLSELSVRLPSAILGITTVLVIFLLARELFKAQKYRVQIALLSSFYLAISPWHILQSRAAMLVISGLFFLSIGVLCFLKGIRKKALFYVSSASFALSIYSYYGMRVVTPLFILYLIIHIKDKLIILKKELFLSAFLGIILLLPLYMAFKTQPDVILGRAKTVSIFYDQGIRLRKWELFTQDGIFANTLVTRLFHNNYYMYGRDIMRRFLLHLDLHYLFFLGDQSQPFQIPNMGILNFADLIFIPLGILYLFKEKYRWRWFIIFWFIASIVPAAFTFATPSSNRTFNAVYPFAIIAATGLVFIRTSRKYKLLTVSIITIIYSFSFGYFTHQYFKVLPVSHADWWNYGWKQVVQYVNSRENKYNNVVVPDVYGMPYVYFLFYTKYPPASFQKNAIRPYTADRFGFEHVEGFDKYLFPGEFDWNFTKLNNLQKNSLYVISENQASQDQNYKEAIYFPNGKIAFKIFEYE